MKDKTGYVGNMVEWLSCSEVWLWGIVKELKAKRLWCSPSVFELEGKVGLGWSKFLESLFESVHILLVAGDRMMLEFLLLFELFLIVVAIPEIIVFPNVLQNASG